VADWDWSSLISFTSVTSTFLISLPSKLLCSKAVAALFSPWLFSIPGKISPLRLILLRDVDVERCLCRWCLSDILLERPSLCLSDIVERLCSLCSSSLSLLLSVFLSLFSPSCSFSLSFLRRSSISNFLETCLLECLLALSSSISKRRDACLFALSSSVSKRRDACLFALSSSVSIRRDACLFALSSSVSKRRDACLLALSSSDSGGNRLDTWLFLEVCLSETRLEACLLLLSSLSSIAPSSFSFSSPCRAEGLEDSWRRRLEECDEWCDLDTMLRTLLLWASSSFSFSSPFLSLTFSASRRRSLDLDFLLSLSANLLECLIAESLLASSRRKSSNFLNSSDIGYSFGAFKIDLYFLGFSEFFSSFSLLLLSLFSFSFCSFSSLSLFSSSLILFLSFSSSFKIFSSSFISFSLSFTISFSLPFKGTDDVSFSFCSFKSSSKFSLTFSVSSTTGIWISSSVSFSLFVITFSLIVGVEGLLPFLLKYFRFGENGILLELLELDLVGILNLSKMLPPFPTLPLSAEFLRDSLDEVRAGILNFSKMLPPVSCGFSLFSSFLEGSLVSSSDLEIGLLFKRLLIIPLKPNPVLSCTSALLSSVLFSFTFSLSSLFSFFSSSFLSLISSLRLFNIFPLLSLSFLFLVSSLRLSNIFPPLSSFLLVLFLSGSITLISSNVESISSKFSWEDVEAVEPLRTCFLWGIWGGAWIIISSSDISSSLTLSRVSSLFFLCLWFSSMDFIISSDLANNSSRFDLDLPISL